MSVVQVGEMFEGCMVHLNGRYPAIYINRKDVHLHVLVWERANGPRPKGNSTHIHHKDHDPLNYDLDNLELLSVSDHRRLHSGWTQKDGEWIEKPCSTCKKVLPLSEFYRKGSGTASICKECYRLLAEERYKDPEHREYLSQYERERYLKNREQIRRQQREYYLKNRERIRLKNRELQNDPEVREQRNQRRRERYHQKKREAHAS